MIGDTAEVGIEAGGVVTFAPVRIYTGILGQIGDIVLFSPTVRRLKQLFPNAHITFAVSRRYREAGELLAGLPYVDQLFVAELYFEKLGGLTFQPWERGWPVDLRGDDEVVEQRRHDLVLETRPRHRRDRWWEHATLPEELAHMVGVPGPIDPQPEIRLPPGVTLPPEWQGKIVFHNDPCIDPRKGWPWEQALEFLAGMPPASVAVIGKPGPAVPHALDLRGRTTLAQTAALIAASRCFVGIESGPTCIAAALQVPTVALFGTAYIPVCESVQPRNPRAIYLQTEGTLDSIQPGTVHEAVREAIHRKPSARPAEAAGCTVSP